MNTDWLTIECRLGKIYHHPVGATRWVARVPGEMTMFSLRYRGAGISLHIKEYVVTSTPGRPSRHSIRLKDYDYSQAGAYFVTICVSQRECLFGKIANGRMELNDRGRIVMEEWKKTENIRKNIILDEFIVMPNHFHGIMFFSDSDNAGALHQQGTTDGVAPAGLQPGSIGAIMAQFKSIVTKRINRCRHNTGCYLWQRNYYERVIRNENELSRAREYIVNNPLKWELDQENPVNC